MKGYSKETTNTDCKGRNIDKWIVLELMHHVEQVYNIAGMLSATMEDLSDQITNLVSEFENLSDATDAIQEKTDEIVDLIHETMGQSETTALSSFESVPF